MTIEEIDSLTEEEFDALSPREKRDAMQMILDHLASIGMAYKGEDGRYRMSEDVQMFPDGTFLKPFAN